MRVNEVSYFFDSTDGIDQSSIDIVDKTLEKLQEDHKKGEYAVILHNDSINNIDYVIEVIEKVFGFSMSKAFWLTLKAHLLGSSKLWCGNYKKAMSRKNEVISFGPDPRCIEKGAGPLKITVEKID